MATVEIQQQLQEIEKLRDVVNLSAETILGGKFTDVARDEFWDGKGQEFHIKDGDRIVCRIIEIPEDSLSFREVKTKLKRQGKKGGELFTIVVTSQSGEGDLLEKKIQETVKFVRVESRISSESVDVKHDLRYFEVDPNVVEPLYIDYLNELQINGRSLKQMEKDVTEIFSIKRITKNFYSDFSDIFHDKLKPAINNLKNEDENLTSYAQLVVNRILFLMFVQEKGWLNENKSYIQDRYSEIRDDDERDAYNDFFKPLFFEALNDTHDSPEHLGRIPYLNGGLFEERPEEKDVEIDEDFFEALLSPEENEYGDKEGFLLRYKLSLSENNPAEQELVVDPEFIGRIFEMFMVSEERSEKGAFYTPKEITQYMSKNAIKQLLLNELPEKEEEISQLVLNHTTEGLEDSELETIQEELEDINVLDPAVGSGAFIIAVMEELVEIQEAINGRTGEKEDRFNLKEHMIARNLYGVDIDESGIELCKFRTWLHLIQDLHIDLDELMENNDRYALPNLDFKFFVGNSLAGDFKPTEVIGKFKKETDGGKEYYQMTLTASHDEEESIIDRLKALRREYTNTHGEEKHQMEDQILHLQDELEDSFNWKDNEYYMDEVVQSAGDDFKWSVHMPEVMAEGGFDIVIGNPPYLGAANVDADSYIGELSDFYDKNFDWYEKIPRMQFDIYQKFIFRGWELTKQKGVLNFITSRTFLTTGSKISTRNLLQNNRLTDIVVSNPNTFDAAVKPAIFTMIKEAADHNYDLNFIQAKNSEIDNYRNIITSDGKNDKNIKKYVPEIKIYRNSIRKSFFEPNDTNMAIYDSHISRVCHLAEEWKQEIIDSSALDENIDEIKSTHISDLEEGDTTLLGLITLGGLGMTTGNNDKYLAYIEGSKDAEEVKNRNEDFEYVKQNENQYKWMSRVIKEENIANVENLSEEEKREGIESEGNDTWIPIEKGFKKGEEYYKPTTEYVDWSKESVRGMKDDGVFRNTRFHFESGIFSSRGGFANLQVRYTNNSVIDVSGVILVSVTDKLTTKYLVGLLNSEICEQITDNFINASGKQTQDMRHIPIVLPTENQKERMEELVDDIIEIKKGGDQEKLQSLQSEIDSLSANIYEVDFDE